MRLSIAQHSRPSENACAQLTNRSQQRKPVFCRRYPWQPTRAGRRRDTPSRRECLRVKNLTAGPTTLEQPIFDGGAALNAVRRASASVRAARETLATLEAELLVAAASAYAEVIQARAIVVLQSESLKALQAVHALTRERLAVRDVTISDIAQSEAALVGAQIQVGVARANLANAEGQFLQVVRRPPGALDSFKISQLPLPGKFELAAQQADRQHPAILAAMHRAAAGQHNVAVVVAKYGPTVSLHASYQNRRDFDGMPTSTDLQTGSTIQAVAHIPLYSGGSVDADVQSARHTQISLVHELAQQRAVIRSTVTQAWSNWQQTNANHRLLAHQIDANARALAGLRHEQSAGQRAVIDVLNAERDLVRSRVELAQSNRNTIVAGFVLLASVGELTLQSLVSGSTAKTGASTDHTQPKTTVRLARPTRTLQKPSGAAWSTTVQAATSTVREH